MDKYTLKPGEVKRSKMSTVMVAKNNKLDKTSIEYPFDYIYYNWHRTEGGFVVYQEMYNNNKEKQLNRMFIPDAMADDFSSLIAGDLLLD